MTTVANTVGDRYILLSTLGSGGMGMVYAALDRLEGQQIALKRVMAPSSYFPTDSTDNNQDLRVALTHEFRTLAGLRHPNVIPVLDYGFSGAGQPYFTMPLIENASTLIEAAQDLDIPAKVGLLLQMLGALAYLHRRDILHCDLKPGNVLVDNSGVVRVLDFGLASSRAKGTSLAGTVHYIAPELLNGAPTTSRSDIYAAGILAYQVLTGQYPYTDDDLRLLINHVLQGRVNWEALEVVSAAYPVALGALPLAAIVRKMMHGDPAQRYAEVEPIIADWCAAIGRPLPPETPAVREGYIQAATFVGREEELGLLTDALGNIQTKTGGSAWLIGGESGVGKSRLLEELRVRALIDGALVLRGQGVEGGGLPYQVMRDALRRLVLAVPPSPEEASILKTIVPDMGELLGLTLGNPNSDDDDKTNLTQTVVDLFRRLDQPTVLLLEDLQWSRRSLAILQRLVEQVGTLRLMIVATYRSEEWPELPTQVQQMRRLQLARLDKLSVAEYAQSMLILKSETEQVVDFLYRETEGNAFFLVEVMRVLAEQAGTLAAVGQVTLPKHLFAGGVETVIAWRLSHIPPTDQLLLQVAAVAGRAIDVDLLSAVDAGVNTDAWLTTCVNAAVLEANEGVWRFAHDKLREHILKSLPPDRLANFHRVVALAIEKVYPAETTQSYGLILAEHWRLGGDAKREHYYLTAFGSYITRIGHRMEAVKYLRDAMSLFRRLGDAADDETRRRQIRSGVDHGLCLMELNKLDEAIEVIQQAGELAEALGDAALRGTAQYYVWYAVMLKGEYGQAEAGFRENLAWAEGLQQARLIGRALDGLARCVGLQHRYAEAVQLLERCLTVNATLNETYPVAYVQIHLGHVLSAIGEFAQARASFDAGLSACRTLGYKSETAWALAGLAQLAIREADWATCARLAREVIEISQQTLDRAMSLQALMMLGRTYVVQGRAEIAATWLGMALHSPQNNDLELQQHIRDLHTALTGVLDAPTLAAALVRGQTLKLSQVLVEASKMIPT